MTGEVGLVLGGTIVLILAVAVVWYTTDKANAAATDQPPRLKAEAVWTGCAIASPFVLVVSAFVSAIFVFVE